MSDKWTPGPWKVEEGGITGPNWQLVVMPRDGHVYSEYTSDSATLEIDNPADARLIAAAPTMASYIAKKAAEGDQDAQAIMEAVHAA